MRRQLAVVSLIVLLSIPTALVASPVARAAADDQSQQEFSNALPYNYYNATAITITNSAIVGYATKSNVSVYTAFMTQQQLASFTEPSEIENSVFYQQGTTNYDALLEVPGTYYLVTYNPTQGETANITELYIVDYSVDLRNSTTSVGLFVTIEPGSSFSLPLHVETVGSSSQLQILGASSEAVQYFVEDRSTFSTVFESPSVTITNFTVFPTESLGYNFTLKPGVYYVSIRNDSPESAYVYFQYNLIPAYVNPYIVNTGPPWPTGIASFGIYNYSGKVVPYEVETSSIIGYVGISELKATDGQSGGNAASLQENAVLQVNNTDGSVFTYWPQNVLAFDTSGSSVTYRDNVLNTTGDNAQLSNQSITGTGTTSVDDNNGVVQTYYGNYDSTYTYSYVLPISFVMLMNETVEQGKGILLQMGVRALNGNDPSKVTWYDNITIVDPSVGAADFVVNGKEYTPAGASTYIGSYYDAELVFGGGAGGEAATFQVNANLGLFYWDGMARPFPSLYTFGDDTAEAAYNIQVTNGTGSALVTTGQPDYTLLTNDFNGSLSSLVAQGEGQHPAAVTAGYLTIGVVVAAIVVIALALVLRSRKTQAEQVLVAAPAPTARFCGACGSPLEPEARFCPNCGVQPDPPPTDGSPPAP